MVTIVICLSVGVYSLSVIDLVGIMIGCSVSVIKSDLNRVATLFVRGRI